jgi:transglutaminase-like putative cysteine protease
MVLKRSDKYFAAGVVMLSLVLAGAGWLIAPSTTRQAVDFEVSTRQIPRYVKVLDFMSRHYRYRELAREITQGLTSDRERVLAVFNWTKRNIRQTPAGWPIVDDHILHIIIRGHGAGEQPADVFATLATYAGVPAYWRALPSGWMLAFARIEGKWRVFDMTNGLVLRNARGDLVTREELAGNPDEWKGQPAEIRPLLAASSGYLSDAAVPQPLRAELQMLWPRLVYELRRAIGW